MTLDEVLGRVADPQDKAFLEKIIKDQNSYVTKLETQLKEAAQNSGNVQSKSQSTNDITQKYLEKNMRRDIIAEAVANIKETISPEMYAAVEKDYMDFLDKNMNMSNTTTAYAIDAFALVLGRCLSNKEHPVNKIGKTETPTGTPSQTTTGTNESSVQTVQNILTGQPPVMTGNDTGSASGMPNVGSSNIKNTRDAFASLKNRFAQSGGNRFQ